MRLSTDTSRLRHLLLMALGQEELGQRIKEAREDAGLTQQELADRIGIKQGQTVSNYERGVTEVTTKRLRRIAEATGKPITFFVQDEATEPAAGALEERLEALEVGQVRTEESLAGQRVLLDEQRSLLEELLRRLPAKPAEGEAPPG